MQDIDIAQMFSFHTITHVHIGDAHEHPCTTFLHHILYARQGS